MAARYLMRATITSAAYGVGVNRLAEETSPYLLQHADNPVDWFPWGDEAFARARADDKPVLLSVGYSACHWCHVMEHESFEDRATATVMNERFVNVKVDREERPDVDAIYMDAVVTLAGHGGWPMTVFLTPEGEPFYGGTYFPPERRHGLPSFRDVLVAVSNAYRERHDDVIRQAGALVEAVRAQSEQRPSTEPLSSALLHEAVDTLRAQFDPEWGGFGGAPKFPPTCVLEFLLRRVRVSGSEPAAKPPVRDSGPGEGARGNREVPLELELVAKTLDAMAAGGMYDVVGGGFHRYSVDERWLVPHFEKMLYDNALLVPAYLHGWAVTGNERWRRVVEQTLDYMLRELRLSEGGFASAQDADTEGVEGSTYTWTSDEFVALSHKLEPFEHGRFIVRGELDDETRERLLAIRNERPQPFRDDKVIASWNGLALAALAEASFRLGRDDLRGAAVELAEFLLGPLSPDGELHRTWRNGVVKGPAFLDDYANLAHGLCELHIATGDLRWLRESRRLALRAVELFADDEHGGFFMTPTGGEELVARKKDFDDNPTPSGNSMLAHVLLRLSRIWGDDELEHRAVSVFRLVHPLLGRAPQAFGWTLTALDLHLSPPREVALIAEPDDDLARDVLARWDPNAVVAFGPADDIPLLAGKERVDGLPTLYECERFSCRAPVTAI